MSAIAGILKLGEPLPGERPVDHRLASRMAALLGHRGGGDEGLYRAPDDKAALACRRLAVTDLTEEGQMPLPNETGDMWVALDGEIWNHRALRHSLELEGHQFRSRSDAEVAVHAYERWGPDFLEHLQGMFALALWDDRRGRLVLARDRLGEKPLHYIEARGVLAFASEAAPLVEAMGLPRRLDARGLAQFLAHGLVMPPLTLYEGVRKLGPGEMLMIDAAGMRRIAWWMPCRDTRKVMAVRALPAERHLTNLRTLVENAVADRLAGEVPLGAILDGSPEAAAVAAVARRLLGRP
ncbi:MAG: asparagine synthetase B, partial [Alphaproteobacteria bacterium]|nr:asparagine synthetase B [Alphaproteobacteria bacterium]